MTLSKTTAKTTEAGRSDRLNREILVLAGVVILGTIMTVLDLTVVNVAIPTLGSDLAASIPAIQWVLTGYMLAFATVIPLTGWAAERFGAKRVWLAALVLFLAGSVLAAGAWSIGSLIAFRVLQGLGAGMILPVGQTILAQAAGPQRMGRVMSVIGVPMLLAPVFGPVIGGAIISAASWRWIFLINLPIGAAALIALYFWHATTRGKGALIDVSLLRRRGFAAAAALNLLLVIALFGSLILIPLYYQVVRHDGPLQIGMLLAPQGIGAALALPLAGSLTDRIGARSVASAGMVIAMLGTLAYTQVGPHTADSYLAVALFVIGIGIGATITPSMAAAFQAVSRAEMPRATSALNTIQRVGGAIGTALFAIILQHTITANLPGSRGGSTAIAALSQHAPVHTAAALAAAFGTTFWVAVGLIATALVPALLLPRPRRGGQASADAA